MCRIQNLIEFLKLQKLILENNLELKNIGEVQWIFQLYILKGFFKIPAYYVGEWSA